MLYVASLCWVWTLDKQCWRLPGSSSWSQYWIWQWFISTTSATLQLDTPGCILRHMAENISFTCLNYVSCIARSYNNIHSSLFNQENMRASWQWKTSLIIPLFLTRAWCTIVTDLNQQDSEQQLLVDDHIHWYDLHCGKKIFSLACGVCGSLTLCCYDEHINQSLKTAWEEQALLSIFISFPKTIYMMEESANCINLCGL